MPNRAVFARIVSVLSDAGVEEPLLVNDEHLLGIMGAERPGDYCVGAGIKGDVLILVRGNLEMLQAPLSSFSISGNGTKPDFSDFEIIDYGSALRFGEYESSVDAVLYENDPAYRRYLGEHRKQNEQTFGAALRRLRLQRRLTQDDFPDISAKTIARIENDEIKAPAETLRKLAVRLDVLESEIETY